MLFQQFQHPEGACLSYILGCTRTEVAGVFDPQFNIEPYLAYLSDRKLKLTHIFETHAQADHLSGAKRLSEATGAPVFYHESARANFPVQRVRDGEDLFIGNIKLHVLHTPGHTGDSISVLVSDTTRSDEPWFALTGDTLFVGDVGRPDLDGSAESLYDSVFGKLLKLPDGVEFFPTHYAGSVCGKAMSPKPSSTIGFERRFNPALQFKSKGEFVAFVNSDLPVQPPRFQKVREFNLGFLKEPPIEKTFDISALEITVEEYKRQIDSGRRAVLLDVRNPDEFQKANMGGTLIPLGQLPARLSELDPTAEIVVHCHKGSRSARAVELLYEAGFKNVKSLVGGIDAWSVKIDPKVPRY
jgi:glyoxylase-like metal-dependent hydrolase (beta-lactamase superfamily II)/rhodanese-related sulfurtransferase